VESIAQCNPNQKKVRLLTGEFGEMETKMREGIYFGNDLFLLDQVLSNHIIPISLFRSDCTAPASTMVQMEFNGVENQAEIKDLKEIFFSIAECKKSFALKIVQVSEDLSEIVLESLNSLESQIKIRLNGNNLFNLTLQQFSGNSEKATFVKSNMPVITNGRMLHAEFYGFEDRKPTVIRTEDVAKFEALLGKGCQIAGTMFLKQVPGNFHISTHHKGLPLQYSAKDITARHKVNFLEFTRETESVTEGKLGSKIKTNYLSEKDDVTAPAIGHDVEYYLKIVGSQFNHPIWGEKNFYEYVSHVNIVPKEKNVIRIEFKYEFDPISMRYTDGRKSLTNFIVSLLAIIGGMFATSSLLDRIISK